MPSTISHRWKFEESLNGYAPQMINQKDLPESNHHQLVDDSERLALVDLNDLHVLTHVDRECSS